MVGIRENRVDSITEMYFLQKTAPFWMPSFYYENLFMQDYWKYATPLWKIF